MAGEIASIGQLTLRELYRMVEDVFPIKFKPHLAVERRIRPTLKMEQAYNPDVPQ